MDRLVVRALRIPSADKSVGKSAVRFVVGKSVVRFSVGKSTVGDSVNKCVQFVCCFPWFVLRRSVILFAFREWRAGSISRPPRNFLKCVQLVFNVL